MNQDPENFVSLADFMGLNQGEGDRMANQTLAAGPGGGVTMDSIQHNSDAHYGAATDGPGGGGVYGRTGQATQQGLATYGEFMHAMTDPAARQALVERATGGRPVSGLDSALAGSSGALGQAQKQWGTFKSGIEDQQMRAGDRKQAADSMRSQYEANAAADQKQRQAAYDQRVAQAAAAKQSQNDRYLSEYAKSMGGQGNQGKGLNDAYDPTWSNWKDWGKHDTVGEHYANELDQRDAESNAAAASGKKYAKATTGWRNQTYNPNTGKWS